MANEPLGDIELIHGFDPPEKRRIPIIAKEEFWSYTIANPLHV